MPGSKGVLESFRLRSIIEWTFIFYSYWELTHEAPEPLGRVS